MSSWPMDLVLIRHGESEGNLAQDKSDKGDDSLWTEDFKKRHTSRYRLTSSGCKQAELAGEWIRANVFESFDRYYVSEYVRAMETAAHLGFEGAQWYSEFFLREQDMGVLAGVSKIERKKDYNDELKRRAKDSFYYAPPGGESIANCAIRLEKWLTQLKHSCSGWRVVVVCHGNVLKALRMTIERMNQVDFNKFESDPRYTTYNCQVIHYTRRNPRTGQIKRNFNWVKSICPWNLNLCPPEWREILRPIFSNEELLKIVEDTARLVDRDKDSEDNQVKVVQKALENVVV